MVSEAPKSPYGINNLGLEQQVSETVYNIGDITKDVLSDDVKNKEILDNDSYSSLTLYKIEKDFFLAKIVFDYIGKDDIYEHKGLFEDLYDTSFGKIIKNKRGILPKYLVKYNKNIISYEQYRNKSHLNNYSNNTNIDEYLNDILDFLENKVDIIELNEFIIKLKSKKEPSNIEKRLLELLNKRKFFFEMLEYEDNDILKYFENNVYEFYEYGKYLNIVYENNNFYFVTKHSGINDIPEIEKNLERLMLKLCQGDDTHQRGLYDFIKISDINLLKNIINSKESLKDNKEDFMHLIEPYEFAIKKYDNQQISSLKFDAKDNNDIIYSIEKEIKDNLDIGAIDYGIFELNYFNFEIKKFLKGGLLSTGTLNFNKLNTTNRLEQIGVNENKLFYSNLSIKSNFDINLYVERFIYYLEKNIFEESNKYFLQKLYSRKNKNNIEKKILKKIKKNRNILTKIDNFLNNGNNNKKKISTGIKKGDNIEQKNIQNLSERKKRSKYGLSHIIAMSNMNPFNYPTYTKVNSSNNNDIDLSIVYNDIISMYSNNYKNTQFLKYIKNGIKELLTQKDFKNIHVFKFRDTPFLTLFEKYIDDNTIYLGGLNSLSEIKMGFYFLSEVIYDLGMKKDIILEVALTIGEEINESAEFLIQKYSELGFEIIGEEGEKRNEDLSLAYKYVEMKRKRETKGVS